MNVKEAIYSRKATRVMDPNKPVDMKVVMEILEDASHTASWANSQPWEVFVITGETLKKMNEIWREEFKEVPPSCHDIKTPGYDDWGMAPRCIENMSEWGSHRKEQLQDIPKEELDRLNIETLRNNYYAPVIVILGYKKGLTEYSVYDLGAYEATLMLAAQEKGLATMPAATLTYFGDRLREIADIPEDIIALAGVGIGYPDESSPLNKPTTTRNSIEKFVRIFE
ncbi:p-nitrobenzoate reductase [Lachnospiraceae bacterium TWA4]|nr:p-nitrobenzoate reductase [Lachnospiraceae bacterium TWA4]